MAAFNLMLIGLCLVLGMASIMSFSARCAITGLFCAIRYLFHTHMVYCYIMTNIIMNTHNNNNNKRYNKILKSADSISR